MVALIVGLALAALFDWVPKWKDQDDATAKVMQYRCLESLLGGALERLIVAILAMGVETLL
jgi:hypothetical protein